MIAQNKLVRMTIPAHADFIDVVRLSLYGLATRMGFSFEEIEDMKVAVSEACNNVIVHAYAGMEEGFIDVAFETAPDSLRIAIKDYGESFDYQTVSEKADSLHDKEIADIKAGGLGIYMMQALMDEVEVSNDHGTEVVLTKWLGRSLGGNTHAAESNVSVISRDSRE
ncbi:anti-sigma B factor RsbW [Brevibacillus laterosporus]|uniref:anti-sigma B factor RsbW n=1 Tax=Brevibacillus TaxID=55080 RepID=UPI001B048FF0|nr:anti-sigma B factor RsbW [Brevibacillus halotolerans]GIO03349.1 serine-protein kinase RsbW [Brevibacillus halotolerans]